jgi:hypothetical protein
MTKSRITRTFALLTVSAVVLTLSFPNFSYAQDPQSATKPTTSDAAAPSAPKSSKKAAEKDSEKSDAAILTKESAAILKDRPVLVSTVDVEKGSFTRQTYRVEWRAKDPFQLYVLKPKGVTNPPVILYIPTFPDDTELFESDRWGEVVTRGGFAAVGLVGAVVGHRTRYRYGREWFVSEMPEALTSTTHDVQLILNYLASRNEFDLNHVGMVGVGSGGAIAILASVVEPRIKALDVIGPWGDWQEWLGKSVVVPEEERAKYLKPEFLETVTPLDPIKWLPKVQAKSVLIEDIRGNKSMPDKSQEKLEAAAPNFALINQYGNGRAFLNAQFDPGLLIWLKSQLAPDAKPQVAMERSQRIHVFPALPAPHTMTPPSVGQTQAASAPTPTKGKEKEKDNPR